MRDKEAAEYRWLVRNLLGNCDHFIGYPGLPSLNFWTGKSGPGSFWEADWLYDTAEEQRGVIRDLERFPNACVIYDPELVKFWNRGNMDLSGLPLVRYIEAGFKTVGGKGDYSFMVRKERQFHGALK